MPEFYLPPILRMVIMDLPPLKDCDPCCPGFHIAVAPESPLDRYKGAEVYWSHNDTDYVAIVTVPQEAVVGISTDVLAAPASCYAGYWDEENFVTMEMRGAGVLATVSEEDVLVDGQNIFFIGGEIIAARVITQIDDNHYKLSSLLRGRRDTVFAWGNHAVEEPVVLLDSSVVSFSANLADVGALRYFKAASPNAVLADVIAQQTVVGGSRLRPFSPVHVQGTRNTANDLVIRWTGRSRARARLLGPALPHSCCCEEDWWFIEILDPGDLTVIKRTMEVKDARSAIYTAIQQTADGLTPGNDVIIDIMQGSKILGRGNVLRYTL